MSENGVQPQNEVEDIEEEEQEEGNEEESEVAETTETPQHELKTCPVDFRFPHTNQTTHCYVNFVDYHRCTRLFGSDDGCEQFKLCYKALCPNSWVEKWDEQLEQGSFPYKLPPKPEEEVQNGNGNGNGNGGEDKS